MRGHIGGEQDHSRNIMIDSDIEQVYIRRARKDRERGGIVRDNLPGGVVVQFTFISYLDCSYYTTEERETFGKENYLSLWWQSAKTDKHILLIVTYREAQIKKSGNGCWLKADVPAMLVLNIWKYKKQKEALQVVFPSRLPLSSACFFFFS